MEVYLQIRKFSSHLPNYCYGCRRLRWLLITWWGDRIHKCRRNSQTEDYLMNERILSIVLRKCKSAWEYRNVLFPTFISDFAVNVICEKCGLIEYIENMLRINYSRNANMKANKIEGEHHISKSKLTKCQESVSQVMQLNYRFGFHFHWIVQHRQHNRHGCWLNTMVR